jgi:hypothetical protein
VDPAAHTAAVKEFVLDWRNRLRTDRWEKLQVWNDCWATYRGQEDFSNREDWQTKIVLPKAWGTVKSAVSTVKRLMGLSQEPWNVESTNNQDPLAALRADKITELTKVFLEKCRFKEEFATGLETGFIMGLGVWKVNWLLRKVQRVRVQQTYVPAPGSSQMLAPPPDGTVSLTQQPADFQSPQGLGQLPLELLQQQSTQFPTQLPGEALLPPGSLNGAVGLPSALMMPQKQTIREEITEGELSVTAVDPYNFYWLPGSKLNRWTGTIEDMEVPKWELLKMARNGAFPGKEEAIRGLNAKKLDETTRQSMLRFGERAQGAFGPSDTNTVKITEFYGPLILDGELLEEHAHIIIANDDVVLYNGVNDRWHQRPPYVGFSPLQLPFRTEGVGLVEMVRSIDRALSQIVNLSTDTLIYRLMPLFEMTPDVYENPEELATGLTPGKILRRNTVSPGTEMGLRPVEFQDVSGGAVQVAGILDRAHQEGGLVSELQQSLPRWSGAQSATETQAIQQNQNSFFGSLAADIEANAIAPLVDLAVDTIMQYLDTAKDPRVAQILGMDQAYLAGMSQPEVMELVAGDYQVTVKGLSGQLEKAEMLQNLIQFMNLIGQNPEAWLPYLNQDALLRRILESFRPHIHDLEEIIADPATAEARQLTMQQAAQQQTVLGMIPQLAQLSHQISQDKLAERQTADEAEARVADQALALQAQQAPPAGEA